MLLSDNRFQMRRSSVATSDGQMDHGQVRKPRISRQKPVTWPDMAFGHLTPSALAGAPWRAGGSKLGDGLVPWRRGLYNQPPVNPARRSPVTRYGQRRITFQS